MDLVGVASRVRPNRSRPSELTLLHIATRRERRGRGYGGCLVRAIADRCAPRAVVAETDVDAVGFYRRLGFSVTQVESPWPAARYRCVLPGSLVET